MTDEPKKAKEIAEKDTPLQGIELPDDAKEAGKMLLGMTQKMQRPPLWCVKPGFFANRKRPEGIREYDHCALVVIDTNLWLQGYVKLIYHDKTPTLIKLDDMHCGTVITTHDVEQQYRLVQKGHRDLTGKTHV